MTKLYSQHIDWHVKIHQNDESLPWLLMIHGFMGSGEVYTPLIPSLSEFCNPVTLDLPGHGQSGGSDVPSDYSEERLVTGLRSVLTRLQLKPLIIHGYSMGGRLALQFALRTPDMLDALILESTTCGLLDERGQADRVELDNDRASQIELDYKGFLKRWQQLDIFGHHLISQDYLKLYDSVMKNQNPQYLAAHLRGFGTGIMSQNLNKLHQLNKPVCLLAGQMDKKFVTIQDIMHTQLPNPEMNIIQDAGHRVHADQPERFIQVIKTFIKQHGYELEHR